MTDGLLPGADRDLVNVLRSGSRRDLEAVLAEHEGRGHEGGEGRASRVTLRGRGHAERADVRPRAGRRRPAAELDDAGPRRDRRVADRRTRLHRGRRAAAARPSRRSSPSATWPASRCWRTRRRTRGASAVEAIAGDARSAFEPAAIPAVVFTDPEIAWCGLTETQAAKRRASRSRSRSSRGRASGRAITLGRTDGLTKLVLDPKTERVLGVGICRPRRGRADRRRRARHRDGRHRRGPRADHPPAPDAVRDADGSRRSLLRPGDARVPAEASSPGSVRPEQQSSS